MWTITTEDFKHFYLEIWGVIPKEPVKRWQVAALGKRTGVRKGGGKELWLLWPEFYTISCVNKGQLFYKFIYFFILKHFNVSFGNHCQITFLALASCTDSNSYGQLPGPSAKKSSGATPCLFIHLAGNPISNEASMSFHKSRVFNSIWYLYGTFHLRAAVHVTTLSHHVPVEKVGGGCY